MRLKIYIFSFSNIFYIWRFLLKIIRLMNLNLLFNLMNILLLIKKSYYSSK